MALRHALICLCNEHDTGFVLSYGVLSSSCKVTRVAASFMCGLHLVYCFGACLRHETSTEEAATVSLRIVQCPSQFQLLFTMIAKAQHIIGLIEHVYFRPKLHALTSAGRNHWFVHTLRLASHRTVDFR